MVLFHFPLWNVKVKQNGEMKKNITVYLTFHHGFILFTIMESQGNTEWGYE